LLHRLRTLHRHAYTLHREAADERVRLEVRRLAIDVARIAPIIGGSPGFHARVSASELADAATILLRQLQAGAAPGWCDGDDQ
jgi:hypothetical protein